ncbi:MAG: hypothetical protein ATN35_04340 [Epulopiscium sp. Nele67-Bin004]|nr:MAG: hypothetical protein ATN35_04340 [Epulopiscium sp. Nele67-Bin004]
MADKNKVEVNVRLKIMDVLRYNMGVAYRTNVSKVVILIGLAILGYIGYKYTNSTETIGVFLSRNIVMIMLGFFILVGTPFKVWKITAMQMQSPIFAGTSKYVFQPDKIYISMGDVNDIVPWETYSKIRETNTDFRFHVDPVQAQIIPKHCMNDEELKKLRSIIEEANPEEIYDLRQ